MKENILVIGSGFSFHSMGALSWQGEDRPDLENDKFQDWRIGTCTGSLPRSEREERMAKWKDAPSARYYHPREEHLMPLHVCLGMARGAAERIFDDRILGKRSIALMW